MGSLAAQRSLPHVWFFLHPHALHRLLSVASQRVTSQPGATSCALQALQPLLWEFFRLTYAVLSVSRDAPQITPTFDPATNPHPQRPYEFNFQNHPALLLIET